jgi:alkylhydroperoxidase family enzyme
VAGAIASPTAADADAFVHQFVDEPSRCPLREDVRQLLDWVQKITLTPSSCRETDVAELRESGWSDAAIHDAAQVTAYFNYINRVADALGVDFEPGLPRWGRRGS